METFVFLVAGAIVLAGAVGVIVSRNPVHAALSLVASLFGVAVLFVAQEAHFLAAVQVIVYTGAIVVLILFVLMLLGVDEDEDIRTEPITGQRPLAVLAGVIGLVSVLAVLFLPVALGDHETVRGGVVTGAESVTAPIVDGQTGQPTANNIEQLGGLLFTDYVYAFEVTALLLTIAVVGAVVLARRISDAQPLPPEPEPEPESAPGPEPAPESAPVGTGAQVVPDA